MRYLITKKGTGKPAPTSQKSCKTKAEALAYVASRNGKAVFSV